MSAISRGVVNVPLNSKLMSTELNRAMTMLRADRAAFYAKLLGAKPAVTSGLAVTVTGVGLGIQVATGEGFDGTGLPIYIPGTVPATAVPFGLPAEGTAPTATLAAAHATLPRIDLIYLRTNRLLTDYASVLTSNGTSASITTVQQTNMDYFTLGVVQGTPNASPVAPAALLATDLVLAQVTVPAAAVTLVGGNVADVRLFLDSVLPRPLFPVVVTSGTSYSPAVGERVCWAPTAPGTFNMPMPANPRINDRVGFKDVKGLCSSFRVTLTPASGTIENQSVLVVGMDGIAFEVVFNGTQWVVV